MLVPLLGFLLVKVSATEWLTASEVKSFRGRGAAFRQHFSQEAFTDTCCCKPSGQRIKCEVFIHS